MAKSFQVPGDGRVGAAQRLRHPLRKARGRTLSVLEKISFDVAEGEFFGIVGRNGSGKSTLLKLLASIYRADRGRIRLAGQLAPFIELGVGFHPELVARDNVVLNGVMMGLTPVEARRRFEDIVAFAGLEEYTDLKLKNYSSGMKVRLGFSVMAHVDADVLLIDEVLAVGDAAFQEKCGQVFRRLHAEGKTILLVTHSMPLIEGYCDRAMLIHDGLIHQIGDPHEVASRYLELNFLEGAARSDDPASAALRERGALPARIVELAVEGAGGPAVAVEEGTTLEVNATVAVDHPLERPGFFVEIQTEHRRKVFTSPVWELRDGAGPVAPGGRLRVRASVDSRLTPGGYLLKCGVAEQGGDGEPVLHSTPWFARFDVTGPTRSAALVTLDHEIELRREARLAEVVEQ